MKENTIVNHEQQKPNYSRWMKLKLTSKCNLNCKYCISKQYNKEINEKLFPWEDMINYLKTQNITHRITFIGGGEPFLDPRIIEVSKEISKNHYLSMTTNLTSKKIKTFGKVIPPERVLQIHASAHLLENERKGLFNTFVENFNFLKSQGFPIFAEAVAYPGIIDKLNYFIDKYKNSGIDLNFGVYKGTYKNKVYPQSYANTSTGI